MEENRVTLDDIIAELQRRVDAHEDGVLLECFNKLGYSNDEVYAMIADGRVAVSERNQKFKDILIDGEYQFTLEYKWEVDKLEDSIVCHFGEVPPYAKEQEEP